jgi:hypothetical protein
MKLAVKLLAAAALAIPGVANAVSYVYVGAWSVGDGPSWPGNPPVYTGQQAAALLFGGSAASYAISTVDSNPLNINFKAHVDGWADSQYLFGVGTGASQSFSLDTGGSGYNSAPGYQSAYSAYVRDHSGAGDQRTRNFAFRIDGAAGVPEPATWAMMILGFAMVGGAMRRTKTETRVRFAI